MGLCTFAIDFLSIQRENSPNLCQTDNQNEYFNSKKLSII